MTATRMPWLGSAGLTVLVAAAVWAQDAAAPDQAQSYLTLRQELQAVPFTPEIATAPRATWRGKTFELVGRITGRTNSAVTSADNPLTFMLQVPGVAEMVVVDSPRESEWIAVERLVHVLAEYVQDARPTDHLLLRAVVAEEALPEAEQAYASLVAAAQAQDTAPAEPSVADQNKNKKPAPPQSPGATAAGSRTSVPARPGTEMPRQLASDVPERSIAAWMKWVADINPKLTQPEVELIVRAVIYYSALYGLDHRLAFAVIKCESDFNPKCVSSAGAMGLTQLMPGTAKAVGCGNPWDLESNIRGGLKYLSDQLHAYAGHSNYQQCALGLAAYNAGPNAVKRAGGVPNIPETVRYVRKVTDLFYQLYKDGMP